MTMRYSSRTYSMSESKGQRFAHSLSWLKNLILSGNPSSDSTMLLVNLCSLRRASSARLWSASFLASASCSCSSAVKSVFLLISAASSSLIFFANTDSVWVCSARFFSNIFISSRRKAMSPSVRSTSRRRFSI